MKRMKNLVRAIGLYMDDLLLVGGGTCLIAASAQFGRTAALTVSGVLLIGYAVLIARSRRGGR